MADREENENISSPLVFRLHESTPKVVRDVLLERGWKEFDDSGQSKNEWNLQWRLSAFQSSDHDNIKPWQRLNHHPQTAQMTKKDCLTRHLKRMKGIYGSSYYEFSPVAFILPNDYTTFIAEYTKERSDKKTSYWICKPTDLSRGRGIFIFQDIKDLAYDCTVVVQKYITNPLLISGYKFDLRIYVCVTSFHPLIVYVYKEGLVRFATEKFNLSFLDNIFAHLTNTSINKYSASYNTEKERIGRGCKWSLGQFRSYLHGKEVDDALLWEKIYKIVTKTLLAIAPSIPPTTNCFELFGFDILIDDTLTPWLLEVNFSPALSLDCSVDVTVKKELIHDIIDLLNYKSSHCQRETKTCKKANMNMESLHLSFPQKNVCNNISQKAGEHRVGSSSRENDKPFTLVNCNESHHSLPLDESEKVLSKVLCNHYNSKEQLFKHLPESSIKKKIVTERKTKLSPRNTLTSKLRERLNMCHQLPGSKSISKTHQMFNPPRPKLTSNLNLHSPSWQKSDYHKFPLYCISDPDRRPLSQVGNFVLVFPLNDSCLGAASGTDVKNIIQQIGKTKQKSVKDSKNSIKNM
ncbi:hypothetical protein GDO86_009417 [Hymenochirus boettgeri]|uniref:Tubulin polyglutamylase TTLL2 n=1 Tax=Hymenochirus boettgeri TaxID=247094 RepID=A0A8T2JNN4_9PIPI|nr:hypothetical protein GDO86_009417 [Hymenochirus boettgeri]